MLCTCMPPGPLFFCEFTNHHGKSVHESSITDTLFPPHDDVNWDQNGHYQHSNY